MKKISKLCEFCQNPLLFSHVENKDTAKELKVYDCKKCPVLLSFAFNKSERVKTIFIFHRNSKPYTWTDNYLEQTSYIIDLMPGDKNQMIIKFPKTMSLTPTNYLDKFAFYIVFI